MGPRPRINRKLISAVGVMFGDQIRLPDCPHANCLGCLTCDGFPELILMPIGSACFFSDVEQVMESWRVCNTYACKSSDVFHTHITSRTDAEFCLATPYKRQILCPFPAALWIKRDPSFPNQTSPTGMPAPIAHCGSNSRQAPEPCEPAELADLLLVLAILVPEVCDNAGDRSD